MTSSIQPSDARPYLRDLNAPGPARRLQGLARLADRGDWTLQNLVAPHLDAAERDVRVGALVALAAIGDRRWADRARTGLDDDDPAVRGASAALLAALGPSPDETAALLGRAGDTDFEVVRALLDLAARPATTLRAALAAWLPAALAAPEPGVRRTAALLAEAAPAAAREAQATAALEALQRDAAAAPFVTSALDAWRAEHDLAPMPMPPGRVATAGEAARRAVAALARKAPGIAARYGWEVAFAYSRLPTATEVATAVWPGLDAEAVETSGAMNPDGHHWVSARIGPRARRGGPVTLGVLRRVDLTDGRRTFDPDPRVPTLDAFDARVAARPDADALLLVEIAEGSGRRTDADRAAVWLAEALGGTAAGPWVREP
jgi:hypothetical protein